MPFNPAQNPQLNDFQGGQMTDLPSFPFILDPTALFEIVSPGNAANGVNYSITALNLGLLIGGGIYANPTFVTAGASYNSVVTDTRILVNKTIGSATSVVLALSAGYQLPVLVKDLKRDSDTNPITVTFSGGQTMDGLSQVVINNPAGYFWFNPLAAGGWYDAAY
jgi:hypothetical protein